jgi:prepilin-type N-terminal cleavage/methylation domain-containing protein
MKTLHTGPMTTSTPPPHIHGTKEKRNEMFGNSTITTQRVDRHGDKGFTLIEILIAIVLIGVLSAVAVVGISSLISKGSSSACEASLDASKAASAVYFASNANTYPNTFTQLTAAGTGGAPLTMPSGVTYDGTDLEATYGSWTLTMTPGSGTNAPTFLCTP